MKWNSLKEVGDSGWLQSIYGKSLKIYPCINIGLAIFMMEDTAVDFTDKSFGVFLDEETKDFIFRYKGDEIRDKNFVNVCVLAWIKYKS